MPPRTDPATLLSRRFPAKRAFITGAASGLGLAIAQALAREQWTLGLLDLSGDALERAAAAIGQQTGTAVVTYRGDVADPGTVDEAVQQFARAHGGLDVMVNNAGVAVAGLVEATPVDDWRWIVDINLLGVVWGCRAALPLLKRQNLGLVLNIASSAGFAAAPQMSAYNATKAAVIALTETLVGELAGTGVQASVAMPGFFRTHLLDHMRAPPEEGALAHRLMDSSGHDAQEAAQALLAAAAAGDVYIVWPRKYKLAWRLKRHFPHWFLKRVQAFRDAQLRKADRPPG